MNQKSNLWKIAAVVLVAVMLAGCGGAQPSLEPTVDAQPTYSAIQTQAVQTALAEMTLNAPTATPELPTATALPPTEAVTEAPTATPEPVVVITTVMPTVLPTNTRVPATLAPAATATPSSYNCSVTDSSPDFGWDIRPGGDFDGRWTVKNTGTDAWKASEVDIKFVSGTKFHTNVEAMDLGADVAKDGSYSIVVDMLAPNETGRFSTTWAVVRGSQTLCVLPLTIDVVQ